MRARSVNDFRGLLKGPPLLAIKTQVVQEETAFHCNESKMELVELI